MSVLRRALLMLTGLICAGTLGFIVLPLSILLDPQIHSADPSWLASSILAAILHADDPERLAASVIFVWISLMTVCLLPLFIAALVGEIARFRAWIWYAAASGTIAAAIPLVLRFNFSGGFHRSVDPATTALEHRLLLLFFITGVISGSLYWLMAGRTAGVGTAHQMRSRP